MSEYQEYPKWLHHPASQAAVISVPPAAVRGQLRPDQAPGAPMTYPPVMVHSPDDEAYYVSRGYNAGEANREAYERQTIAPPPPGLQQRDFPMYGDGGLIIQDPDAPPPDLGEYPKWVGDEIAHTQAEEDEILSRRPELAEAARGSSKNEPVKPPEVSAAEWAEFRAWKAFLSHYGNWNISAAEWAEFRAWKAAQRGEPMLPLAAPKSKSANRRRAPSAPKRKRQLSPEHLAKLKAGRDRRWSRINVEKQGIDENSQSDDGIQVGLAS